MSNNRLGVLIYNTRNLRRFIGGHLLFSCFVSHSSKDAARAQSLVAELEQVGLTCWIAPRDVQPGAAWSEEIMRGIEASRCFVLLLSDAANLSDNVLREVERASSKGKAIYPVRIEDVAPSTRLEYFISVHHWIDAVDGLAAAQAKLLAQAMVDGENWSSAPRLKKVENPYTTEVKWTGPILPDPIAGEAWEDQISSGHAKKIEEAKIGENGREWSVPLILTWHNQRTLFLGGSQRLFSVHLDNGWVSERFNVPRWRERYLFDFASYPGGDTMIVGNTFRRTSRGLDRNKENYSWATKTDTYHNPDWGRVTVSKTGDHWAHSGLVTGTRSKNFLKRFLAIPDTTSDRYEVTVCKKGGVPVSRYKVSGELLDHRARMEFSPSGKYLAFSDVTFVSAIPTSDEQDQYTLQDWRPQLGDEDHGRLLAWHPTRDIYACVYGWRSEEPHGFVIVDAATRECLQKTELTRKTTATAIDWSPDGRFLAMGGADQAIFLWDFETGSAVQMLGHHGVIDSVHFSHDGKRLLSTAHDHSLFIWNSLKPEKPVLSTEGNLEMSYMQRLNGSPWSPDGRSFAAFGKGHQQIKVMTLQ
ncbi:TIR domain-containing protein [Ruegeria sp. HKCCD6228]|uniref:toll/interleukin-1 receptor domain-containing protein n=1 Tax=unclassified Ruegeria TaxID=2625375 RepID=UPI001489D488|nr:MULTISPECIES: TIR domain-containing protein [unclassified Ruegeria]NOD99840.1 TIR domain-containing protein [Ruegeria sp. HKCCD6228]